MAVAEKRQINRFDVAKRGSLASYTQPKLKEFGSVQSLVQAGTMALPENMMGMGAMRMA